MHPSSIDKKEEKFESKLSCNGFSFAKGGSIKLADGVEIIQLRTLNDGYYRKDKTDKKSICVHFTAGSVNGDIPALSSEKRRVSVNYYLDRRGNIYELVPEENWAPNIGPNAIGGGTYMSKHSFSIEVSNYGPLKEANDGSFIDAYGGKYVDANEKDTYVYQLQNPFRGYKYYCKMSEKQENALALLLSYLCGKYKINPVFYDADNNPLMPSADYAKSFNGIYTHANVRSDKFDWPPEMMKSVQAKVVSMDTTGLAAELVANIQYPPERPGEGGESEGGGSGTPSNGHYSGRIRASIEKANEQTKGTEGKFYSILNNYGFYDIADANNGLTDWQRAGVPEYNQKRMTALCNAVSDMITDFLKNDDYGVLCPGVEQIIDKLDMRGSMNKTSIDSTNAALSANPLTAPSGAASTSASQALESLVAAVMGGNPFDPDLIPPLAIGFSGLPIDFANCFKPGFINPDWNFLYEHETVHSKTPYEGPDGTCYIGAGIPLATGGSAKILILKLLFSVPDVDENANPVGDSKNGVTAEQFEILRSIADKMYTELTDEEEKFELTEDQMRMSYIKYVQLVLWGAVKNPNNWAYLHWGAATHNSCPGAVKTAIMSFLKTNGVALDPKDTSGSEECLVSYLLNTGMAYLTGVEKRIPLIAFKGIKYRVDGDKNEIKTWGEKPGDPSEPTYYTDNNGVPRDNSLAQLHFTLLADLLCRLTNSTNPNAYEIRNRRIDEANLIYKEYGIEQIKFGESVIPSGVKQMALKKRHFFDVINTEFQVYENKNLELPNNPNDIKIVISNGVEGELSEMSEKTIRYLASMAKIPGVVITSLYRDPEEQARTMFNNRQRGNGARTVSYAAAGRSVDDEFDKVSIARYGKVQKLLLAEDQELALNNMIKRCSDLAKAGTPASKHGGDPNVLQAIDIGPNSTIAKFNLTEVQFKRFHVVCLDALHNGYLRKFFCPKEYGEVAKDPAFHIEVWQDKEHKHPDVVLGEMPDIMPTEKCKVRNDNLTNETVVDSVFTHDQVLKANNE